jgi:hypothetical protein
MKPLITWALGSYSTEHGSAGEVPLFTIAWKTIRSRPDWSMRTVLPDMTGYTWKSNSKDELKAKAEEALAQWLARVQGER